MYELYLEAAAERDLKRLNETQFSRVIHRLSEMAGNPRPSGCRKLAEGQNYWRIRVGDLRVIYEIDDEARAVRVMRVRRRDDAYRWHR